MSTVYRDRDRDRYGDNRTKITRYVVKEEEDDSRSDYQPARSRYAPSRIDDRRSEYDRGRNRVDETKIILRDSSPERREPERRERDEYWRRPAPEQVDDRELVIRRTVDRDRDRDRDRDYAPRERDLQLAQVDDDPRSSSDYELVRRPQYDDRDREVQRYIRTSEYYQPAPASAPQPQTIIIRQEPIIIRERVRPREENLRVAQRPEPDNRSVSRRSSPQEEYFYEKKVRERYPEDNRRLAREVSPHESVSQVGRRRRYSSDDSMVYVRKEVRDGYDSDDSNHQVLPIAAGALAGVGAAELFRKHNDKEGKDVAYGGKRGVMDVGAGVVGAAAGAAIARWRSKSRGRSRSNSSQGILSRIGSRIGLGRRGSSSARSLSSERTRRRRRSSDRGTRRRGSSSSDDDGPKVGTIAGLGLAAAAVAAGAYIAGKKKGDRSRSGSRSRSPSRSRSRISRSRTRRGSRSRSRSWSRSHASTRASLENDSQASDERNPKKRKARAAAVGGVGAAAMALYEWHRHRSKSRGRGRSESPGAADALEHILPVAGVGVAAAGLAALYEKRKAKTEADEIIERRSRRSRSRGSRSSSRSRGPPIAQTPYYAAPQPQPTGYNPTLVQYGNDPLQGHNYGEGYYGRPGPEQDYYYNNNNRDMVPAAAPAPIPPPAATTTFDPNPRSSRRRSLSSSPSRSRSRSRAGAATAPVVAPVAAPELDNRNKERKRRSRDRRRSRSRKEPYTDERSRQDPYAAQTGFYDQVVGDPEQPGPAPQQGYPYQQPPQGQYGPQDFPPPPAGFPQAYQYQDPYAPGQNPYTPRSRGTDENVSAANFPASTVQHHTTANGMNGTRGIATPNPIVSPTARAPPPSAGTPGGQEVRYQYPENTPQPQYNPQPNTYHDIATASTPGPSTSQLGERAPAQPSSRAARTYTPPINELSRPARDRSTSSQISPQSRDVPIVTDGPSPISTQQRPKSELPSLTALRDAAYGPLSTPQGTANQSEEQPINTRNAPSMPPADHRPPPYDTVPVPQQQNSYVAPNDSGPSMPNLSIPSTYVPPTEERRARDRSQSESRLAPDPATPRPTSPVQDLPKKSVSFNPRPEVNELPSTSTRDGKVADPDIENPDVQRRRRQEREQERSRDRDRNRGRRDRERHDYDAGDDFSDDTPLEDHRRRSHERGDRSDRDKDKYKDKDKGSKYSSRRERSNTQSLDQDSGSARDQEPKRPSASASGDGISSSSRRSRRDESPSSDVTIDLPPRFDEKGQRREEGERTRERKPEQNNLGGKSDDIFERFYAGGSGGGSSRRR